MTHRPLPVPISAFKISEFWADMCARLQIPSHMVGISQEMLPRKGEVHPA